MKKIFLLVVVAFISFQAMAQLNVTFAGSLSYDEELSDIWGYQAPDGTEYALVGTNTGFSIVSLADPTLPSEVAFIPGATSTWRDIKTFGTYAYVTTDEGNDGLLVVDLSNLPNSVDSYFWKPNLLNDGQLRRCHNLYIDDAGWMYLAGCNLNNGAVMIFDVFTDSYNPVLVNNVNGSYAHDVFTNGDLMYSSNLTNGLQIFNVADKNNIQLEAIQSTAFNFTHNAWATDNNKYVFTTDELANAPVGAYDVTDLNDVKELDLFKPSTTLGDGVIPHNAHVWNNFVIVSYYSDGCIILDATHPDNLIEVGNFDTYIPSSTGFNGAWGAYPYLPSGVILVSDIQSGLYVLQPNYVQGCYLEGTVTDATNGNLLRDVEITINSGAPNLDFTNNLGAYKTGQANAGTFDVTFFKVGYHSLTTSAVFTNGVITFLDVEMTPLEVLDVTGNTIKAIDGNQLGDVAVFARSDQGVLFNTISNADGTFTINDVFEGTYDFFTGKWGYFHQVKVSPVNANNNTVTIEMNPGYQDDFFADLDWVVSGDASTGDWELGEPIGITFDDDVSSTNFDIENDLGDQCYVTGNGGGDGGSNDIDGGATRLTSPIMDLTIYNEPIIHYRTWFYNDGGNGDAPNDDLIVSISNGTDAVVILETITESASEWRPDVAFTVSDFIAVTSTMTISFEAQDAPEGHIVEANVDAFLVEEGMPTSSNELVKSDITIQVFPNPFEERFTIELTSEDQLENAQLKAFNVLGQLVETHSISNKLKKIELGENWENGVYFLSLEVDGKIQKTMRLVKQ